MAVIIRSFEYSRSMALSISPSSFVRRTNVLSSSSPSSLNKKKRVAANSYTSRSIPVMMPEGPEVRTLVDQLQPGVGLRLCDLQFISGRYTRHGKPKGWNEFKKTMTNYKSDASRNGIDTVISWNAKGKFIWLVLDNGLDDQRDKDTSHTEEINNTSGGSSDYLRSIWITLGMSGRFVSDAFNQSNEDDGTTHKQARWYFEFLDENIYDGKSTITVREGMNPGPRRIYYYDTRNFGTLRFSLSRKELEDKIDSLGPDILDDCTEKIFLEIMSKQRGTTNICKFLMNQSKISGVGNYLLAEALYLSNLDPFSSIAEISVEQRKNLYREIIQTAKASYAQQGMTRRKGGSYKDILGNEGKFAFSLQCYGREVCAKGRKVIRDTNGPHGRTIWYVEDQLVMPISKRFSSSNQMTDISIASGGKSFCTTNDIISNDDTIDQIDNSWKKVLREFISSEKFKQLSAFVTSERETNVVYPPRQQVFAALNICPFDKVKVVIIGQDPYHGPNQGHGLAFSVQKGVKPPPSLRNIFKELNDDLDVPYPKHGNLNYWAEQGVLLLNTVLTVRAGEANSHSRIAGWEDFTDEIVDKLNEEKEGLVFLLWGSFAAKKGKGIDLNRHFVFKTSHPSPLGATKTESPFLGSRCFSKCNDALVSTGLNEIDWNIEESREEAI